MTDLAKNFSEASQQNRCLFEPPQVMFAFFDGVTQSLAGAWETLSMCISAVMFVASYSTLCTRANIDYMCKTEDRIS